jgi:hypothetical protein
MKRLLVLALTLAFGLGATSCSDSTGPGSAVAGVYMLRNVNGITPPVTIYQDATYRVDVLAGEIELDANGNYRGTTRYQEFDHGIAQQPYDETIVGYWTLSGNQIALTDRDFPNDPYVGTINGNSITLSDFGAGGTYTEVYSR